jgi:hypothetical protein
MPSHITLRYNSKIKPFRWPNELSPEDFLRLVANTFGIKGPKIIGFKNKNGIFFVIIQIYSIREYLRS